MNDKSPIYSHSNSLSSLSDQILMVKQDILTRFPDCRYTVRILLWDDDTSSVECRYGDGEKIHTSTFHNNQLIYKEIDLLGRVMLIDEKGVEYFKYLRDK